MTAGQKSSSESSVDRSSQAEPGPSGRVFVGDRKVRLGDVRPTGVLRLDALTRYTQDVSNDDTTDAQLADNMAWVVRRTTVDVMSAARFGERLEFATFCSGLGRRWAERRLRVLGDGGAHYEVATLWIHVDEVSGRPKLLSDQFHQLYGEAAAGRSVSARLTQPSEVPAHADPSPWVVRRVDFDLFGHVNNAAYWAVVEELEEWPEGSRHVIEYRDGIEPGAAVEVRASADDDVRRLWWVTDGKGIAATAASYLLDDPEPMNTAVR